MSITSQIKGIHLKDIYLYWEDQLIAQGWILTAFICQKILSIFPFYFLESIKWFSQCFFPSWVLFSVPLHPAWIMKHISLDLISLLGLSVIYSQQHQIQSCRNWSWLHGLILMCFRWQSYSIFYSAWFRFKRLLYLFCCHIFHTFKIFFTTVFHLKLPVYRFAIKASQCSTLPSDPCDLMTWNFVSNTYQVYIFNHWFLYLFSIHIWDCFQCMVLKSLQ